MQIHKEQILQVLKSRGDHEQAQQAEQELPDQVDTGQHADLLGRFGIDISDLDGAAGALGGRIGL